jgi:hypothetical protein
MFLPPVSLPGKSEELQNISIKNAALPYHVHETKEFIFIDVCPFPFFHTEIPDSHRFAIH